MKYLIVGIINAVYGILLLLTLNANTPGLMVVLILGLALTIIGLIGCILWITLKMKVSRGKEPDETVLENWFSLVKSFDIVLVIGLFFRALVLQPFIVEGNSMENNFHNNEAMLVDKISYHIKGPKRGDVVIFQAPKNPQDDYIKRIIALPEETISISQNKVYINGKLLKEDYLQLGTQTITHEPVFQKTLAKGEYFVMGDNRSNSSDSREWGPLPEKNIIGRAWIIIYPFDNLEIVKNPSSALGQ